MSSRPEPQHHLRLTDLAARESREREWVAAVRTGDAAALEAMFRAYAPALTGFVYGYLQVSDESQEIVQDLFLWIWEHRYEWDVPGSLRAYLFKSARDRAVSRLRHRRVEREFRERAAREAVHAPWAATRMNADQRIAAGELAGALERAISALPERCREVFELNRRQHPRDTGESHRNRLLPDLSLRRRCAGGAGLAAGARRLSRPHLMRGYVRPTPRSRGFGMHQERREE